MYSSNIWWRIQYMSHDPQDNTHAQDMPKEDFLLAAPPIDTARRELTTDRLPAVLSYFTCGMCSLVVDQAVDTPCCSKLFCANYIYVWLYAFTACNHWSCQISNLFTVVYSKSGLTFQFTPTLQAIQKLSRCLYSRLAHLIVHTTLLPYRHHPELSPHSHLYKM